MTDKQWDELLAAIHGERLDHIPVGFIIDSPWLPNWYGTTILDYFSSEELWLDANLKAVDAFPEVIFLPGFWSEFGMCTEPSAFGAKSIFWNNEFPFSEKVLTSTAGVDLLTAPNPETDGLLPFMLNRLKRCRAKIESRGHKIRFSVSRGPLNVASFLMGTTELLTAMVMEPESVHKLLRVVSDFLIKWHALQRATIPTIDGMLILDDIVGFIGEAEFLEFGYPYFKEIYDAPLSVKFFHNDADCRSSVKHYPALGINLFNPGFDISINEIKADTNGQLAVLGNIPPRDVLASGTPVDVTAAVRNIISSLDDPHRVILSCGGGMPPGVPTENIRAFIEAAKT